MKNSGTTDEETYLHRLSQENLLDDSTSKQLDELTTLARDALEVDKMVLAFWNGEELKIKHHTEEGTVPREDVRPFCRHPVRQEDATVIPNTADDHQLPDELTPNPSSSIGAFAGMPLQVLEQNHCLGTLGAFHTERRTFPNEDLETLRHLRDQVCIILEHEINSIKLKDSLSQIEATIQSMDEGVLVVDQKGKIKRYNETFAEMWNLPDDVLAIGEDQEAISYVLDQLEDPEKFEKRIRELMEDPETRSTDLIEFKDGRVFERYSSPRFVEGEFRGRVWCFRDVTEQKKKEEQIQYFAYRDHLTDLPNRLKYLEILQDHVDQAKENGTKLAFLRLDLSNVGRINEILGHSAGDQLIVITANRITNTLPEAVVGRLVGDQFGILVSEEDVEEFDPENLARKVLDEIKRPLKLNDATLQISGKFGISILPTHGNTRGELLRQTSAALRETSHEVGNRISVYEPRMKLSEREELELENDLRSALKNDELEVFYQPFVFIPTGDVTGMEALVRWNHPEHGYISPSYIISLAQTIGQMSRLGKRILSRACQQTAKWNEQRKHPLQISVNISAVEFVQKEKYLGTVNNILTETGLDPELLQLEITETEAMEDVEYTKKIMEKLKKFGVQVAIDDFGTGYSSLQYLSEFPVDMLKIDTSFIHNLSRDGTNKNLVRAIINMCRNMDLRVLAEGVEEEHQLEILQEYGCELYQGYLHCRPMDPSRTEEFLVTAK